MSAASGTSASAPASTEEATKVVGTFGGPSLEPCAGTSVCPPQAQSAVSRRTSPCVEGSGAFAQKIRSLGVDRPRFIFDRMLVASGDTLPALA